MTVENRSIKELKQLISEGNTYRLLRPYLINSQILINIEKILTLKDIEKLENKVFGTIEVIPAIVHDADDKIRKAIILNAINILKTSKLFKIDDTHHLDYEKRKEIEKLISGIIGESPHIAQQLIYIYKFSKKLFIHSINVAIISSVIDLGIQQKQTHHDGLRSEIILTGALLHDVGFLKLPQSMTEKRRYDYNDQEKESYKKYPIYGREIALALGDNIRKKAIDIIYQHQERLTGEGFPEKRKGHEICDLALLVGLADEFDLMMSNEISANKKLPSEIMSRISRMAKVFGNHVVDSFYTWFRYLK